MELLLYKNKFYSTVINCYRNHHLKFENRYNNSNMLKLNLNLKINIFQIIGQPILSNNYRVPKLCKLYLNITEIIMLTIIDLLNRMKKKLAKNKCFYILTIVPLS